MKKLSAAAVLLFAAASLTAKGPTTKILVEGGALAAPLEITAPAVGQFNVWTGPGVHAKHVDPNQGFIADWAHGPVFTRPDNLQRYEVSFYADRHGEKVVYKVLYEYDPAAEQGYVYLLPIEVNVSSIYRGVEGNWFRTTSAWEALIRPALSKAKAA